MAAGKRASPHSHPLTSPHNPPLPSLPPPLPQAEGLDVRSAAHPTLLRRALLHQLRSVALSCGLPPSDIPTDAHVVQALGQPDGDYRQLATPTFVLRRGQLRRRYARELSRLDAGRRGERLAADACMPHTHINHQHNDIYELDGLTDGQI